MKKIISFKNKLLVEDVLNQKEPSSLIQAIARGFLARKKVEKIKHQTSAVIKLQRLVRAGINNLQRIDREVLNNIDSEWTSIDKLMNDVLVRCLDSEKNKNKNKSCSSVDTTLDKFITYFSIIDNPSDRIRYTNSDRLKPIATVLNYYMSYLWRDDCYRGFQPHVKKNKYAVKYLEPKTNRLEYISFFGKKGRGRTKILDENRQALLFHLVHFQLLLQGYDQINSLKNQPQSRYDELTFSVEKKAKLKGFLKHRYDSMEDYLFYSQDANEVSRLVRYQCLKLMAHSIDRVNKRNLGVNPHLLDQIRQDSRLNIENFEVTCFRRLRDCVDIYLSEFDDDVKKTQLESFSLFPEALKIDVQEEDPFNSNSPIDIVIKYLNAIVKEQQTTIYDLKNSNPLDLTRGDQDSGGVDEEKAGDERPSAQDKSDNQNESSQTISVEMDYGSTQTDKKTYVVDVGNQTDKLGPEEKDDEDLSLLREQLKHYKDFEKSIFEESMKLRKEVEILKARIAEAEKSRDEARKLVDEVQVEHEKELVKINNVVSVLEEKVEEQSGLMEELEEQLNFGKEKIVNLKLSLNEQKDFKQKKEKNVKELNEIIQHLNTKNTQFEGQITTLKTQAKEASGKFSEAEKNRDEARQSVDGVQVEHKKELVKINNVVRVLEEKVEKQSGLMEELEEQLNLGKEKIVNLKLSLNEQKGFKQKKEEDVKELDEIIQHLNTKNTQLEGQITTLKTQAKEASGKFSEAEKSRDEARQSVDGVQVEHKKELVKTNNVVSVLEEKVEKQSGLMEQLEAKCKELDDEKNLNGQMLLELKEKNKILNEQLCNKDIELSGLDDAKKDLEKQLYEVNQKSREATRQFDEELLMVNQQKDLELKCTQDIVEKLNKKVLLLKSKVEMLNKEKEGFITRNTEHEAKCKELNDEKNLREQTLLELKERKSLNEQSYEAMQSDEEFKVVGVAAVVANYHEEKYRTDMNKAIVLEMAGNRILKREYDALKREYDVAQDALNQFKELFILLGYNEGILRMILHNFEEY